MQHRFRVLAGGVALALAAATVVGSPASAAVPSNDAFANATNFTLTASGSVTGSNVDATRQTGEPSIAAAGHSVWWKFTAATSGLVKLSTFGSDFDTALAAYIGGTVTTLTELDVNAYADRFTSWSEITIAVTAGTTYRIAVDGRGDTLGTTGNIGNIVLGWTVEVPALRTRSAIAALYEFGEGSGTVVHDTAAFGAPLDLSITEPAKVSWVSGGLRINSATRIISSVAATKIIDPVRAGGGFTIEAWVKPANVTQGGPARIAAIAADANSRNVELTQSATSYDARVRSGSGSTVSSATTGAAATLQHVVFTVSYYGATELIVNGVPRSKGSGMDVLTSWDTTMKLVLGNVPGATSRPWLGELQLLAIYGAGLSRAEVARNFAAGPSAPTRLPAPVNDNFANATVTNANLSGAVSQDATWATEEPGEPGGGGGYDRTVWWSWTPTTSGRVKMTVTGTQEFPSFAVYTGATLPTLTQVASSELIDSSYAQTARFQVTAGTTYRIRASAWSGGDVDLVWEPIISPPNDNFASPSAIPSGTGGQVSGGTWAATAQAGEPAHAGSPAQRSAWWTITPATSGVVNLSVSDNGWCSTRFAVYTGSTLPTLAPVASDSGCHGLGDAPLVRFAATAGVTYRIAVDSDQEIDVQLSWSFGPRPANDEFANATAITTAKGQASADIGHSIAEVGDPSGSTVWWKLTPTSSGRIRLRTCCAPGSSHVDGQLITLSVWSGSTLATLNLIESNYGYDMPNVMSQVSFDAVAGVTYHVSVGGDPMISTPATLYWEPGVNPSNSSMLTPLPIPWTTSGSSVVDNSSEDGGSPLWWSTTATSTGSARVSTTADGVTLDVWRQIGPATAVLVASWDEFSGTLQEVTFPATTGSTYFIEIGPGTYFTRSGPVDLTWAFPPTPGGGSRVSSGLTSLYTFSEGSGSVVNDTSGVGSALNLTVANSANTTWVAGGLRINSATTISSAIAASKITNPSKASGGMTFEAWVKPANTTQSGPARIAAIATDTNTRNIEIAQSSTEYNGRTRGSAGGTITATSAGATTALQHVVFVRDPAGQARLYINGALVSTVASPGNLSTWDSNMKLTLANVLGATPRPWLGELHLAATYGRALTPAEVTQNYLAGANGGAPAPTAPGAPTDVSATGGNTTAAVTFTAPGSNGGSGITGYTATCSAAGQTTRTATGPSSPLTVASLTNGVAYGCSVTATNAIGTGPASASASVTPSAPAGPVRVISGLTSLYTFSEGSGSVVTDTSGVGTPLNLTITNSANTTWVAGGLRINSATTIASASGAAKITDPSKTSGGLTFEAWVKPANTTQSGPARIAAIATDTNTRNIEIAQSSTEYNGRTRGSAGGTITATSAGATTALQHVVFVRDPAGQARLYINGALVSTVASPGNLSTWDSNMKLTLANVLGATPRPWLGELHLTATYGRALTPTEIGQNFAAGADPA